MQNKEQYGMKTGRLKSPHKPGNRLDFEYYDKRCQNLCFETRGDVMLFHDERGQLSWRTVPSRTMYLPTYTLALYRFIEGKVVEKIGLINGLI